MGTVDRVIRGIIAVVLVVLYVTGAIGGTTALVLIVVAAIFFLTSLMSFCPLYLPFGLSTIRRKFNK